MPTGLIFPIKLYDGKYYPEKVKNITYDDFSEFAHAAADSPFRNSPSYLDFRRRVRDFVLNISGMILDGPQWDPRFPEMNIPLATQSVPEPVAIPQPKMF